MLTATNYKYRNFTAHKVACFISVDPLQFKYPELTSFQYASNRPISAIDIDGMEAVLAVDLIRYGLARMNVEKKREGEVLSGEYRYTHTFDGGMVSDIVDIHNGFRSKDGVFSAIISSDAWTILGKQNQSKELSGTSGGSEGVGIFQISRDFGAKIGNREYNVYGNIYADSHVGYENTFRHILWQSTMTILYSNDLAKALGDVHERDNTHGGDFDRTADIINNIWGRKLGEELKNKLKLPTSNWTPEITAKYLNGVINYMVKTFPELGNIDNLMYNKDQDIIIDFTKKINENDSCPDIPIEFGF